MWNFLFRSIRKVSAVELSTVCRDLIFGVIKYYPIPANLFIDINVRVFSWEYRDFWRRHDHFRRFPKKSEVFRRRPKSSEDVRSLPKASSLPVLFTSKRKVLSFIHFTHGFRSLHGSELTYVWKLCQARRQQLTSGVRVWQVYYPRRLRMWFQMNWWRGMERNKARFKPRTVHETNNPNY